MIVSVQGCSKTGDISLIVIQFINFFYEIADTTNCPTSI